MSEARVAHGDPLHHRALRAAAALAAAAIIAASALLAASPAYAAGFTDGAIWRVKRSASSSTVPELVAQAPGASGVAADAVSIYYTTWADGGVYALVK